MTAPLSGAIDLLTALPSDLYLIHRDGGAPVRFDRPKDAALQRFLNGCAQSHQNVYFQGNAVRPGFKDNKPSKADIVAIRALFIDLDPNPHTDQNSERQRLNEMLCADALPPGVPPPSAYWYTGGGYQAAWILGPFLSTEDPEIVSRYEALNKALQEQFPGAKGGGTFNIDRLLRLPGSLNVLNKKKIEEGRKPAYAVLEELNDRRYTLASFDFSKTTISVPTAPKTSASTGSLKVDDITDDIVYPQSDDYLDQYEKLHPRIKQLINRGHPGPWLSDYVELFGPIPENRKPNDRSGWVYDVINNCIRAEVPNGHILGFLLDKRCGISAHIYDQSDPEYAARRQIARGHNTVSRDEPKEKQEPLIPAPKVEAPSEDPDADTEVHTDEPVILEFHINNETGFPYNTTHNARAALQHMGVHLRYDEFSNLAMIGNEPLQDHHVIKVWFDIEEEWHFRLGKEVFADLIQNEARKNKFHPVKDYFASLTWDGIKRLDTWLIDFGGAENSDYTRAVGALPIIAAVRRVYQPGTDFQEILTLVSSKQGTYKSTAIRTLCPNRSWFSDDLPMNAESREVIERLQGHLIIECAETKGMKKGGDEHTKAFLSRQIDEARMAFGRISQRVPRQCVFIATSNDEKLLRDPTGNRRWWPVIIKRFDTTGLLEVRDQIWAEAVVREKEMRGAEIKLDPSLYAAAAAVQDAHTVEHPYVDTLGARLDGKWGKILVADAWELLGSSAPRSHEGSSQLGNAMLKLGWKRSKQRMKGAPQNCFVRDLEQSDGSSMPGHQGQWIVPFRTKEGRVEALYLEERPAEQEPVF